MSRLTAVISHQVGRYIAELSDGRYEDDNDRFRLIFRLRSAGVRSVSFKHGDPAGRPITRSEQREIERALHSALDYEGPCGAPVALRDRQITKLISTLEKIVDASWRECGALGLNVDVYGGPASDIWLQLCASDPDMSLHLMYRLGRLDRAEVARRVLSYRHPHPYAIAMAHAVLGGQAE